MLRFMLAGAFMLMLVAAIQAQDQRHWHPRLSTGILLGEQDPGWQVQATYSRQFGHFLLGPGLGYDTYLYKSMPVFASLTGYLNRKPAGWMINVDAGINVAIGHNEFFYWPAPTDKKTYAGLYWNGGIGYGAALGRQKQHQLFILAGYSHKQIRQSVNTAQECINPPCNFNTETYRYRTRTWSLRLGWML